MLKNDISWRRFFPCGMTFGEMSGRFYEYDRDRNTEPKEIFKERFFATDPNKSKKPR